MIRHNTRARTRGSVGSASAASSWTIYSIARLCAGRPPHGRAGVVGEFHRGIHIPPLFPYLDGAVWRPFPQLVRDVERAGSVPDKIGFMMAPTAHHAANFLISLLRRSFRRSTGPNTRRPNR
jgi:hypothetical protein